VKLQSAGIPTAVHYPVPLNKQPAYRHLCADRDTPVSDWAARHVLSLPMGPDLSDSDMDRVIDAVANATSETRAGCGT
jgi:UDP-2-acetamido-2-deoxy-ribo-hexuluronate aminotransferase